MRKRTFFTALLFLFAAEAAALLFFAAQNTEDTQDAVLVNEAVQSVQSDWNHIENHRNQTNLNYTVLDGDGALLFQTKPGISGSINEAILHRDTILDIYAGGSAVGKIIIYNDIPAAFSSWKRTVILILIASMLLQCVLCAGYSIYLNRTVLKPFHKLEGFAERVAGGNLDVPLEMDRQNLFGAFTESFDIMRTELKKARNAEAQAQKSKKELVAKLSHDIKTPVASIKAVSEVGRACTDDEKLQESYTQIIRKADQINTLITNLFTAALEELKHLAVTPEDMDSSRLRELLENADYLHRAELPDIPGCLLYADSLRLQQVLDNIFANSYKYADTPVLVSVSLEKCFLNLGIEDYGGGVNSEELPLIREKFRRGSHTENIEGAGLGLYISDYFMQEMHGKLLIENGKAGLKVTVCIPLSGMI